MSQEQQKASQLALWELFGKPDWPQAKYFLIQQLQAFLIEIFRVFVKDDKPWIEEGNLYAFVKQHIFNLIRRNGTQYTIKEDLEKTITGTLYGSKFFEKDTRTGTWRVNAEKAQIWEDQMLARINSKKPWISRGGCSDSNGNATPTNYNFLNKTPISKGMSSKQQAIKNQGLGINNNLSEGMLAQMNGSNGAAISSSASMQGIKLEQADESQSQLAKPFPEHQSAMDQANAEMAHLAIQDKTNHEKTGMSALKT